MIRTWVMIGGSLISAAHVNSHDLHAVHVARVHTDGDSIVQFRIAVAALGRPR